MSALREWLRRCSPLRTGRMPFARLVPAIVIVFGLAAVVAITAIGVDQIGQQSDDSAALRSRLLAQTLAERLSTARPKERETIVERAAIRSGAEVLLVSDAGEVVADGSINPPPAPGVAQLLVVGDGETQTALGRVRFYAARVPPPATELSVIVFVPAPTRPVATESLVRLVGAFSAILLGIAALVAYALSRDVQSDVAYVRRRIVEMAKADSDPTGEPIPVRSIDQVGAMTQAFNALVERYTEAERTYRSDLEMATTIERDKGAFLAALSHELKTPLNVILGFTEVLLAEVEGPLSADARENMETVRSSGNHLKALIKDILDLSALESGELTLNREPADVYALANDVLKQQRVSAQDKCLQLKLVGRPCQAWADPLRVRQIIGNLVGNAIKFTSEGSVTVQVGPLQEWAAITVEDTGPGIAHAEQNSIFDDYTQVGDLKSRGGGTGLGLAITRRLVSMHEGQILLRSQLGKGSTFTVLLPTASKQHSAAEACASESPPSTRKVAAR